MLRRLTPSTVVAVTKLMFALWGDDLATALRAPAFRERLAALGLERLQVNVDDEPVAQAMRISALTPPIRAIVSAWLPDGVVDAEAVDGVVGEVVAVLGSAADRVAGWEVTERRPIAPAETWDGSRLDGLANIALLRRPTDLTHDEWLHRWLVDHTPVAIATQATFGYLQNVVVRAVTPDAPPVAALVEELFPSAGIDDIHAFYGSGGSDAELHDRMTRMMASVSRFGADHDLDLVPSSRYLYSLH